MTTWLTNDPSSLFERVLGRLRRRQRVGRRVQGVDLVMPRSHPLPYFSHVAPTYGQNLIDIARLLAQREGHLAVVDVGANIGDSALQVLRAVPDARVLCVEGDPHWLPYLRDNVSAAGEAVVVAAHLLTARADDAGVEPSRHGGTTRFVRTASPAPSALPALTPEQLRETYGFGDARLVKIDTDGWDAVLAPALARAWVDQRPLLFFEHDPRNARLAGAGDADLVWAALADLGYSRVVVYDNTGRLVTRLDVDGCRDLWESEAAVLGTRKGYDYWDVLVAHADDVVGLEVCDQVSG